MKDNSVLIQILPKDLNNLFVLGELTSKINFVNNNSVVFYICDISEFLINGNSTLETDSLNLFVSNLLRLGVSEDNINICIQSKIIDIGALLIFFGKWLNETDILNNFNLKEMNQLQFMTVLILDFISILGRYDIAYTRQGNDINLLLKLVKNNAGIKWDMLSKYEPDLILDLQSVVDMDMIRNASDLTIHSEKVNIKNTISKIPSQQDKIKYLSSIINIKNESNRDCPENWEGRHNELKNLATDIFMEMVEQIKNFSIDKNHIEKILENGINKANNQAGELLCKIKESLNF